MGEPVAEEFGPYILHEELGRGGMGVVYRAFDIRRDRTVALKRLPRHLAEDETFQARFRRESRLAARLNDPHIIPIHDFGEINGQLYIDMRLVEGTDLSGLIASNSGRLPPAVAIDIIAQVAAALTAAHGAGLVHRDVKPSNVLITRMTDENSIPFAYLVDFGIARAMPGAGGTALTATTGTVGTLGYMAPERISGSSGDHRADIYSLACVLYECLTGHAPFAGEAFQVMYAHVNVVPPTPSRELPTLPATMDEVIRRGMAKDPAARYQTANQLANAARAALSAVSRTEALPRPAGHTAAGPPPQSSPPQTPQTPTPPPQAPFPPPQRSPSLPPPQASFPPPPQSPFLPPPQTPSPPSRPAYTPSPSPSRQAACGPPRAARDTKRRTRILLAIAAVVVLAGSVGIGVALGGGSGTPAARHTTSPRSASGPSTHDFPSQSLVPTTPTPSRTASTPPPDVGWLPYSHFTRLVGTTPGDKTSAFRDATCALVPPDQIAGMLDQIKCTNLTGSPVRYYVARFSSTLAVSAYLKTLVDSRHYQVVFWTTRGKNRGRLYTSPTTASFADVTTSFCHLPNFLVQFYAPPRAGLNVGKLQDNYWKQAPFPNSVPAVCS